MFSGSDLMLFDERFIQSNDNVTTSRWEGIQFVEKGVRVKCSSRHIIQAVVVE